jgi:U3 small nucleolar RNA-associated protein 6
MADIVQLTLESMLEEIDYFVKEGYFTKVETKNILKKRRFYEYQFENKQCDKEAFIKAIKYEFLLDKRRKKRKIEKKIIKENYFDFHFVRRVIFLYKKCLRKFEKDEELWIAFFQYLIKHKSYNILNKEMGHCLSIYPHNLLFWKIAAYNEFEYKNNALVARNYFQKSLRINKTNFEAYLDYFIFELKFIEKIIKRRSFLEGKDEK